MASEFAESDIVLQIQGVTKTFPGVVALSGMTIDLRRAEVHAVCGENGAGQVHPHEVDHGHLPA